MAASQFVTFIPSCWDYIDQHIVAIAALRDTRVSAAAVLYIYNLHPAVSSSIWEFPFPTRSISVEKNKKKTGKSRVRKMPRTVWWTLHYVQYTHLVPAFERVLPPLHQVALADARDTEVQRGARNWTHIQLLQVIHHLPVTGLPQRKQFYMSTSHKLLTLTGSSLW